MYPLFGEKTNLFLKSSQYTRQLNDPAADAFLRVFYREIACNSRLQDAFDKAREEANHLFSNSRNRFSLLPESSECDASMHDICAFYKQERNLSKLKYLPRYAESVREVPPVPDHIVGRGMAMLPCSNGNQQNKLIPNCSRRLYT